VLTAQSAGWDHSFFVVTALFGRLADGGFDSVTNTDPVKASVQLGNSATSVVVTSASRTMPAHCGDPSLAMASDGAFSSVSE